tara:strand:- start:162 stop:509 length:348 start_codon:yes stop_codon:yes gene_type:complete
MNAGFSNLDWSTVSTVVSSEEWSEARQREGRESMYASLDDFVAEIRDGDMVGLPIAMLESEFGNGVTDTVKQVKAYIGKLGKKEFGIGRVYRFAESDGQLLIMKTTPEQRLQLTK